MMMEPIKLKANRFLFQVYPNKEEAFMDMAQDMIKLIKENNRIHQPTLMIVPVGPIGQYPYFVQLVLKDQVSLKNVTFINMDEYMVSKDELIHQDHHLSFKKYMQEHVYGKIPEHLNIPESQRIFPDPKHPEMIMDIILKQGYVDACYGGIGLNGHVAFNEPIKTMSQKAFLELPTRVVNIATETLVTNALNELDGAYDYMPKYAITIGFKEINMSKKIRLYCFRPWHKSVIQKIMSSRPTTTFPVTLLRNHPDLMIGLTDEILYKEK